MKASESMQKTGDLFGDKESTELSLFVRTSDEEIKKWDRSKIYDALMRETTISEDAATIIAREVEKMIYRARDRRDNRPTHPRAHERQAGRVRSL